MVKREREDLVVHFPHYDKDEQGPASTLLLGSYKLIRVYETGSPHLFNLASDAGEAHDLAKDRPREVAELDRRLTEYLKSVNAQVPTMNAAFDPANAKPFEERKGGKGKKKPEAQ
jgi:hypothetical protein